MYDTRHMSYRELGDDIGDTRTDDVCTIPDICNIES